AVPLESDSSGGWDTSPSVAINASGVAIAVWVRYDTATSVSSVRANRLQGGNWGAAPVFIDALDFSVGAPGVSVDASGNAIAVWVQAQSNAGSAPVAPYANRFDAANGWGTP